MHAAWKVWRHPPSDLVSAPTAQASRHTQHLSEARVGAAPETHRGSHRAESEDVS